MEYAPRNRSAILAQILAQNVQQTPPIQSWGELAARLGAQAVQAGGLRKDMAQQDATQARAGDLAAALMSGGNAVPYAPGQQQAILGELIGTDPRVASLALENMPKPQGPKFEKVGDTLLDVTNPQSPKPVYTAPPQPTDFERRLRLAGIDPSTPEGQSFARKLLEQGGGNVSVNVNTPGTPLPDKVANDQAAAFVASQERLANLREVGAAWRPEFSTVEGKAKAGWASLKDKFGQLSPDEQKWYSDFEQWKVLATQDMNEVIKSFGGSNVTASEMPRIRAGLPSPDDGPTAYRSKYNATVRKLAFAAARTRLAASKGQSIESMSLDRFENIYNQRGDQIANELKGQGVNDPAALQKAVKQRLIDEFGV